MNRLVSVLPLFVALLGCQQDRAPLPLKIKAEAAVAVAPAPKRAVDFSRWKVARTFSWEDQDLTCVAFSPDNRTIAVGGGTQRRTDSDPIETGLLQLWDVETGEVLLSLTDPDDEVRSVVFDGRGTGLAVGDRRKTKLIDIRSGTTRITIAEGNHFPIAFDPHKKLLALKPDVFYDYLSGQPKACPVNRPGTNGAFSPDGTLFCADLDIWDLRSGRKVAELGFPGTAKSTLAAFSRDRKSIAMEYGIWKTSGGQPVWMQAHERSTFVTGITFTPDDRFLLISDRNGELRISEVPNGKLIDSLKPHESIEGMALAPNGSAMVTIGPATDGQVKVWKPKTRPAP
jgi:WD40 repeat protein